MKTRRDVYIICNSIIFYICIDVYIDIYIYIIIYIYIHTQSLIKYVIFICM